MKQPFTSAACPATRHNPAVLPFSIRVAVMLLAAMLLLPARLHAGETITWMKSDRPVSYILSGPDKGKGVVDQLYSLLWREIDEYNHHPRLMSFGRALKEMNKGENLCAVGFKTPEREAAGYFSIPAVATLPYSIVAKKGRLEHFFGNVESISLRGLLARGDLRGAVAPDRSYGELNPLMASEEDRRMLQVLSPGADKVEVLMKERVDYILEIGPFMTYMAKQKGYEGRLTSFAIEESTTPGLTAYVFCTRNEWGREMIDKINMVIRRHRATPEYLDMLEHWFDENARPRLREHYRKAILMK